MAITFTNTVPVLRMFSIEKAREFYIGYLGFAVDWEHRFEPSTPLYMQVSRAGLLLHLSEHYGDCAPGAKVFVEMTGVAALHAELTAKAYNYLRPGLEREPWGATSLTVIDPFMNRIVFNESDPKTA
ncbi:bleomycin resistance protein [Afipia sp. P52-10]|uniref:glyoxalase superfamily protein n=1 Tax=Afipia sp. P52-10 TaxID=1429916 RepID=UPI0003DF0455|nr:glyoxalase superfamily protein [Afipia sp. P52-10]ETR77663.1 bleomycin resistance protein [Afipia sp. P52-10]